MGDSPRRRTIAPMNTVRLEHIRKRFDDVVALDDVSLTFRGGRVHGLLGENGAGKSTAMNVLYGLVRPDSGTIEIDGRVADIRSPRDAMARGIGMVHQHFMLAPALRVVDNVLLGERGGLLLRTAEAAERLRELSRRLRLEVEPMARVEELSVGQQQRVEILKALYRDARLLILDEPTAVLTPQETDQLLAAIDELRRGGCTIVFISHKLGEVKHICDDVSVLRRGRVVWEGPAADASAADLARHMVGRDVVEVRSRLLELATGMDAPTAAPPTPRGEPAPGGTVLALEDVEAVGVSRISMRVGAEIFGVAGVDGNGQQELAELLVGLRPPRTGRILLAGRDITAMDLRGRAELGVASIPNDRKREGLVLSMSVAENIALKHHRRAPFSRFGVMSWAAVRRTARQLAQRFDVRMASVDAPVASLSGGNQQKLVLARELAVVAPRLIVAMNPTRGLDIAATNFVYERLLEHRDAGCAIILISSELNELLRLSDRMGVLYRGRLTISNFPRAGREAIGRLMAGLPGDEA